MKNTCKKHLKKSAFTLIELLIVISIIVILAIILFPKAKYSIEKAKMTGVDQNRRTLISFATSEYEKQYDSSTDDADRVQKTYDKLSKIDAVKTMQSPFDKNKIGLGFIDGSTFTDTGKAAYIFTEQPDEATIPDGIVYVALGGSSPEYIKDIISGLGITYMISSKNNVYALGNNLNNIANTGASHENYITTPTRLVTVGGQVKKILGTFALGMYIDSNGDMYTWGRNYYGQLGLGDYNDRLTPTKVSIPNNKKVKDISYASSYNGDYCSFALTEDGTLYGWGDNGLYGALGIGNSDVKVYTPTEIKFPNGVHATAAPTSIDRTTYAFCDDGNLYAWGYNNYGSLGINDTTSYAIYTPTIVPFPAGVKPLTLTSGRCHHIVVASDGNMYAWRLNSYMQLSVGSTDFQITKPTVMSLPNGAKPKFASAGVYHSMIVDTDGNLYAVGNNDSGQLGLGDTVSVTTPKKVTVPNNEKVTDILSRNYDTLFLTSNGSVYILEWDTTVPKKLNLPSGVTATSIVYPYELARSTRCYYIKGSDGNFYAYGDNSSGLLGTGNTDAYTAPVKLSIPSK